MKSEQTQQITERLADAALLFASRQGASAECIRARTKFRRRALESRGLMEFHRIGDLFDCCAQELNDPYFGLHLGGVTDFRVVGTISYAITNAPSIRVALSNLVRYQASFSHRFQVFFESTKGVSVGFELAERGGEGMRHLGELCIAIAINSMRSLINQQWHTAAVKFQHQCCGDVNEYQRSLGCVPQFAQCRTELQITDRVADELIPYADRTILPIVERQLASVTTAHGEEDPLLNATRVEIAHALCDGAPNVNDVAHGLQLSTRTLQRQLRENGSGFRQLLCEVRQRLAREYLKITDVDLLEVALLLGYSDLSAFDHAFRDWFNESPSTYRKRVLK